MLKPIHIKLSTPEDPTAIHSIKYNVLVVDIDDNIVVSFSSNPNTAIDEVKGFLKVSHYTLYLKGESSPGIKIKVEFNDDEAINTTLPTVFDISTNVTVYP